MNNTGDPKDPLNPKEHVASGVSENKVVGPKSMTLEPVKPLNSQEKQRLNELERVINAKLGDFFEVGSALVEIKSEKLFRESHSNFGDYCQDTWGFGRSYGNKLVGSAERIKLLPEGSLRPSNEFQIRPFLRLKVAEFPQKWRSIVEKAGKAPITAKIVEDSLGLSSKARKKRKGKITTRPIQNGSITIQHGSSAIQHSSITIQYDSIIPIINKLLAALNNKNFEEATAQLNNLSFALKL